MADVAEIRRLAKKLNLTNVASGAIDLNDESVSNLDYLQRILMEEIAIRTANKLKGIRAAAMLPRKAFDHTRISEGLKWQLSRLKGHDFANERMNVLIVGDCSTGKTSLAAEIGNDALEKGARVIYVTLDDLVFEAKAKRKRWPKILDADLIVIDDVFYVAPETEELTLIYRTLMFLQETRSLIVITNRPLSSWKEMKGDPHLIETLQRRLTQDAQIISLA